MHELTKIAKRIGRSDKATSHLFTEFYGPLLAPRRKTIRQVLEIGICDGGSIMMWHEFLPRAQIHAIDVRPHVNVSLDYLRAVKKIHLYFEEAYSKRFLTKMKDKKFDFILDDGPHTLESWQWFLKHYRNLLAPDGIMVVEDIFTIELAEQLIDTFPGDRNRLSIIDRRATPGAYKEQFDNEILLLYM
jgi:spermidine synthase